MTTDYATLSDLHTYLGNIDVADTTNDAAMSMAITAASSAIERYTNRQFKAQDVSATTRYYTASQDQNERWLLLPSGFWTSYYEVGWPLVWTAKDHRVVCDDLFLTNQVLGDIVVKDHDTQAVIAIDRLWPFNAAAKAMPFTQIWFPPTTYLPKIDGGLDILAKWGWVSVPTTIKNACLLQAARYLKRKESPLGGIAGSDAFGAVVRAANVDPDIQNMLTDYKRWWAAA